MWIRDRIYKATYNKKHPERAIRMYPYRLRLSRSLRTLYKGTVRDVRRELQGWSRLWVLAPSCFWGIPKKGLACYDPHRHEIHLSVVFRYWERQTEQFLEPLSSALWLSRHGKHHVVHWKTLGADLLRSAAQHRELFLEDAQHMSDLDDIWQQFLQRLPPALEACMDTGTLAGEFQEWYEELQDFHQEHRRSLGVLLVHELVHAHAQRTEYTAGRTWARLTNFEGDQKNQFTRSSCEEPGEPFAFSDFSEAHDAFDEALTEWITSRIADRLYDEYRYFHWKGYSGMSTYPLWIIELMAQALDHHWEHVARLVPALQVYHVASAAYLLQAAYFDHPRFVRFMKSALTAMTRDGEAFEKVARACQRFALVDVCEDELLRESLEEIRALFTPVADHIELMPGRA